ncbi:MAG TPA: hypothetical protein VG407_02470 [Caulobacteraceae bacterium]|nr:hypothetical protein [Caulobacteraceae bacterium]
MLLELSKEFGRIAGLLLDPLLWFLMFALAVGTKRWLAIPVAALGYVIWATLMLALAEAGAGGWSLATSNFLERLLAALICGMLARLILQARRRAEARWEQMMAARRPRPDPDAGEPQGPAAPG